MRLPLRPPTCNFGSHDPAGRTRNKAGMRRKMILRDILMTPLLLSPIRNLAFCLRADTPSAQGLWPMNGLDAHLIQILSLILLFLRSEERRVGKERKSRW